MENHFRTCGKISQTRPLRCSDFRVWFPERKREKLRVPLIFPRERRNRLAPTCPRSEDSQAENSYPRALLLTSAAKTRIVTRNKPKPDTEESPLPRAHPPSPEDTVSSAHPSALITLTSPRRFDFKGDFASRLYGSEPFEFKDTPRNHSGYVFPGEIKLRHPSIVIRRNSECQSLKLKGSS